MWTWIWLAYAMGAVIAFRISLPRAVSAYQHERSQIMAKHVSPHYKEEEEGNAKAAGVVVVSTITFFWPLIIVAYLLYHFIRIFGLVAFKLMFPRGIVTEFDKKQKEKEEQEKYKKAKALLEQEGINVEGQS
ncbi:MAG TPA: hypothetical protein VIV15_16905 [Anaerolineales bacterium]